MRGKYAPSLDTAPRKQRAKAAAATQKDSSNPEKGLGKIWDHWAVKANTWIDDNLDGLVHLDGLVEGLLGQPRSSTDQPTALTKEEDDRQRRKRRMHRKQQQFLSQLGAAVFGPAKSQEELAEEEREREEAALQAAQLARLQEKFAGRLTLL